jgi:hypothetical protein
MTKHTLQNGIVKKDVPTPKRPPNRIDGSLGYLNGHFSDSDGGADGTVGKLGVTRVRPCYAYAYART